MTTPKMPPLAIKLLLFFQILKIVGALGVIFFSIMLIYTIHKEATCVRFRIPQAGIDECEKSRKP